MQMEKPLTPTLSPSDGEREKRARALRKSLNGMSRPDLWTFPLSPSDGERAGERGAVGYTHPGKAVWSSAIRRQNASAHPDHLKAELPTVASLHHSSFVIRH